MKNLNITFIIVLLILTVHSCKKQDNIMLPEIADPVIKAVNTNTFNFKGSINSDGGATISKKGICWSLNADPKIENSMNQDLTDSVDFACNVTGLTSNTIYHIRAYAKNKGGIGYSNDITVKTYALVDTEGNGYYSILINDQTWMSENLKTTKFKNGTDIPNVTGNSEWNGLRSPGYCWYENDLTGNRDIYGALYNWYAVATGDLCPVGWHVPTDADWSALIFYLRGSSMAALKMKEPGKTHWYDNNAETTNETGFTALPAGLRGNFGDFH